MTSARRLFPAGAEDRAEIEDVYEAERPRPAGRPWVISDFVASIDGAVSVQGRSGGLGGPADKAAFRSLRAASDVVLAGAGTARAEGYGPSRPSDEVRARRRAAGRSEVPAIALVSNRLDLDWDAELFTRAEARTIVITHGASDEGERARAASVADVLVAGADRVDLAGAVAELGRRGAGVVVCEGGPTLNGMLVAEGLVDEMCLTVAPMLVAGAAPRVAHGRQENPQGMRLETALLADEGHLLLRYVRIA